MADPRLPSRTQILDKVFSAYQGEFTLVDNSVRMDVPRKYWLPIIKQIGDQYDTMTDINICGIPRMESCIGLIKISRLFC